MRALHFAAMSLLALAAGHPSTPVLAAEPSAIERDLTLAVQGVEKHVTHSQAMALLPVSWGCGRRPPTSPRCSWRSIVDRVGRDNKKPRRNGRG